MNPEPGEQQAGRQLSGLSTRITVIVFWGLGLLALGFGLVLLHSMSRNVTARRQAQADQFAYSLSLYLSKHPHTERTELQARLGRLNARFGATASTLRTGAGQPITVGTPAGHGLEALSRPLAFDPARPAAGATRARVTLYYPSLENAIANRRKWVLSIFGIAFLALGVLLKLVLEGVLTRPMLRMVDAARGLSRGRTGLRFDEKRPDEFGYLAEFINEALDTLEHKQEALGDALVRVQRSETDLAREKELAEVTLHSIGDGVATTDRYGRVQYLNPAAERIIGLGAEQARGRLLHELMPIMHEGEGESVEHPVLVCLRDNRTVDLDQYSVLRRADGREVPIADSAAPIRDADGHVLGAVMVFHDVSDARQLQNELSYQASHDPLTGLYNRREFERELSRALARARRDSHEYAICYLDLDQFKVVNDTCGHTAGDELLRQLARRLQDHIREADTVARLGGDEFGVLLQHCSLPRAMKVADDLRKTIRDFRFAWQDKSFRIGASIGVVALSHDTASISEALSAADVACYAAKEAGRDRVHVYHPDDAEITRRRGEMALVSQINDALSEDRLCLYCQPIVPTRPGHERLRHFEVLVRMLNHAGELVPPGVFIPAAERYGLMSAVDRWVVQRTLRYLSDHAHLTATVSVNLSGQSLCDERFLDLVVQELHASGVPARNICFEVTETAAIANLSSATRFMHVLHDLGCRFALDDFGSGLSSFSYLKNLPVDYLKIDGSFVRNLEDNRTDRAMVQAINEVGHVMGMETIAECVENEAILAILRELNVDFAQGYGTGRPGPIEHLLPDDVSPAQASASH